MYKRFILALVILNFVVQPAFGQFHVNFQKVKLVDFVKFVSEFTGRNFVYNPDDLRGTVTIQSKTTMTESDIMQILKSVLELNNLAMIDRGNYIQIVRKPSLRSLPYENIVTGPEKKTGGGFCYCDYSCSECDCK